MGARALLETLLTACVLLFLAYWAYGLAREHSQKKLWRTWEERFAYYGLAAFLPAVFGLAAGSGGSAEDYTVTIHLKPFSVVFLIFYLPTFIGLKRGQHLAAKVEKRRRELKAGT